MDGTTDAKHLEQIKREQRLKNVVMDGSKVGKFGKVGREQKLKNISDGRSQK